MRSTAVFCFLPIYIISTILQSQAQPINDTSANECCIEMTDAKVTEINTIVQKITDFIAELADKYEDFDLSLVKVDVDKHCENEDENKSTVLELYVNDCAKRASGYNNSDNGVQNNYARQSENENVAGNETIKTLEDTREANSTSRTVSDIKQPQNDHVSSELNVENVKKNTTKKTTKYQVTTNIRKDTFVNDDTNNIARRVRRNDESLATNVNRNDKSTENMKYENTSNETKYEETTSTDNTYQKNNITSYDENTSTDDQADNKRTSVKNTTINKTKNRQFINNVKSTSNYADDTEIGRRSVASKESHKKKTIRNIGNSNDHDENTSTESDNNNFVTKNHKNNDSNNEKGSSMFAFDDNKSQQSRNNLDEYELIKSLQKVIRNEMNSINDNKNQQSEEFDNDFNVDDKTILTASSNSFDYKPRVHKYGIKSKPQLIKIDLDDNTYDNTFRLINDIAIPRFKTSYYNPWIMYMQERLRGQQQYNMFL